MEVEDFGSSEARIRLTSGELDKIIEALGQGALHEELLELQTDMIASAERGMPSILRPAPRKRVRLGDVLGSADMAERAAEAEEEREEIPPAVLPHLRRRTRADDLLLPEEAARLQKEVRRELQDGARARASRTAKERRPRLAAANIGQSEETPEQRRRKHAERRTVALKQFPQNPTKQFTTRIK